MVQKGLNPYTVTRNHLDGVRLIDAANNQIFQNDISGNAGFQANSDLPVEFSVGGIGNYRGRNCGQGQKMALHSSSQVLTAMPLVWPIATHTDILSHTIRTQGSPSLVPSGKGLSRRRQQLSFWRLFEVQSLQVRCSGAAFILPLQLWAYDIDGVLYPNWPHVGLLLHYSSRSVSR